MVYTALSNTLRYDEAKCINCGICMLVCPHGVFGPGDHAVRLVNGEECMECGACQLNCPVNAIAVESGVGCAEAMIRAALRGKKLEEGTCGCGGEADKVSVVKSSCCGVGAVEQPKTTTPVQEPSSCG